VIPANFFLKHETTSNTLKRNHQTTVNQLGTSHISKKSIEITKQGIEALRQFYTIVWQNILETQQTSPAYSVIVKLHDTCSIQLDYFLYMWGIMDIPRKLKFFKGQSHHPK
jgi:hypothetical protein